LEYRNIYNGLQTKTYLPIQLDASCNGIQHLSIMSANSNLAKLVNLMPSDYCDEPYDLYSIVLDEINKKIVKLVEEDSKHILLKKLNLDRKLVKRSIMTIPYNVTLHGVVDHLQEFFKKEWKDKNLLYKPIDSKHGTGYITQSDIFKLAGIIRSTLFEMHPELNDLINYFKKMVDIFNQLNMPVVWKTPTGLKIKQKYLKTQSARIRSGYYRGASFNILIPTNKISKVSQKNSFMPNLIHSMDAATITHLISKMKKGMFCNIYTIHDCFATTACNIPQLNVLVRESFISLYADKSFVKSLHKLFIEYILGNYSVKHIDPDNNEEISILISSDNVDLDDILDHKFVVLTNDGSDPVLPKLPKLDEFTDLRNNIRKALYKIG
jgi:DNA-directed RNA polymerase